MRIYLPSDLIYFQDINYCTKLLLQNISN